MDEEDTSIVCVDGEWMPEAELRRRGWEPLGAVPDLEDEELADPDELERQVYIEEFGPVLQLPVRGRKHGEACKGRPPSVSFGVMSEVRFSDDYVSKYGTWARIEEIRERLADVLIMFSMVKERLPRAASHVLKLLNMGVVDEEHIESFDMLSLWRLWQQAERLREELRSPWKHRWGPEWALAKVNE